MKAEVVQPINVDGDNIYFKRQIRFPFFIFLLSFFWLRLCEKYVNWAVKIFTPSKILAIGFQQTVIGKRFVVSLTPQIICESQIRRVAEEVILNDWTMVIY